MDLKEKLETTKDTTTVSTSIKEIEDIISNSKVKLNSNLYGHHLFSTTENNYFSKDSSSAKISDNYVLGIGDELTISIFGVAQFDAKYRINKKGYITPPGLPKIFLKGVYWKKAKELIKNRFNRFYRFREDQFSVSVSSPRQITVHIFGEVNFPGSYDLLATNNLFNSLFIAGGLTAKGSVRKIKVIVGDEDKEMDLYELINNPIAQFDYSLEDNAIIQVPSVGSIVKVKGAINRPFNFEIKEGEGLNKLFEYAGGLTANAYQKVIQIKRFDEESQILVDVDWVDLKKKNKDFLLRDGDDIHVREIPNYVDNIVSIEGAVEQTGNFSLTNTPNIDALIKKAVLKRTARLDVAFLIRTNPNDTKEFIQIDLSEILKNPNTNLNIQLQPEDRLLISEQSRYADVLTFSVSGAVRGSIRYPFYPNNTISIQQAIILAGGLNQEAANTGYIIRTNPNNPKDKEYVKVNVIEAMNNPNGPANIPLQPLDELIVLNNSSYENVARIAIKGAINKPGSFIYDESLTIKDVLLLSGGFKREAATNRLEVYRITLGNNQSTKTVVATLELDENYNIISNTDADFKLMPFDEIQVRTVPEFELQTYVTIQGEVLYPGEYALTTKNETIASIISRAGGITEEAFREGATITRDGSLHIVNNLEGVLRNKNSKFNYLLKRGDIITIPKREDLVYIDVANTRATELGKRKYISERVGVPFETGKSAKWYINEYVAGFGREAHKKEVLVEYTNGIVKGTQKFLFFKKHPKPTRGARILVRSKAEKSKESGTSSSVNDTSKYPKLKKGVILSIDKELMKNAN